MVLPRSERQPGLRMIDPKWISLETLPTPSLRFHILSSLRGVMQGRAGGLVLRGLKKKPFSHQSFELFEQLSSSLEQKPAGRLCPQSRETYTGDRGVLNYDDLSAGPDHKQFPWNYSRSRFFWENMN